MNSSTSHLFKLISSSPVLKSDVLLIFDWLLTSL